MYYVRLLAHGHLYDVQFLVTYFQRARFFSRFCSFFLVGVVVVVVAWFFLCAIFMIFFFLVASAITRSSFLFKLVCWAWIRSSNYFRCSGWYKLFRLLLHLYCCFPCERVRVCSNKIFSTQLFQWCIAFLCVPKENINVRGAYATVHISSQPK